jgi:hypothetical protein
MVYGFVYFSFRLRNVPTGNCSERRKLDEEQHEHGKLDQKADEACHVEHNKCQYLDGDQIE